MSEKQERLHELLPRFDLPTEVFAADAAWIASRGMDSIEHIGERLGRATTSLHDVYKFGDKELIGWTMRLVVKLLDESK